MKTRALFSLLLASLLLFASLPALALDAEPAPDSVVSPGDTIAYTYVLPADMTNCVLRFSLSSGVSLQPDSVQVKASGPYEVVYGSDGCVIMADALDKGDTLVGPSWWRRMAASRKRMATPPIPWLWRRRGIPSKPRRSSLPLPAPSPLPARLPASPAMFT